jgi:hypothetical protein
MPEYRVTWVEKIRMTTWMDADSEDHAIQKIKDGDRGNDVDSEPMTSKPTQIDVSDYGTENSGTPLPK